MDSPNQSESKEIIKTANQLIDALNNSNRPFKKQLWQNIMLGAMSALGGVLALALLIPLIIFILSQFEWIPTIGDFIKRISDHIESSK
jgi:hypothetical protein